MKIRICKILLVTFIAASFLAISATALLARFTLGDLLKVGGIAYLVDRHKKPIDEFINKALGEREAQAKGATKVVAILSIGTGGYIGAAQVVGVPSAVEKAQAVVQVEIPMGSFRATGMIPVSKKDPSASPSRVKGVGVSAVIDFKI